MKSDKQGKLKGRIAVITGAGRKAGIGAAVCRALAAEGADIFFIYWAAYDQAMPWGSRNEQGELQQEIKAMGVRCESLQVDLRQPDCATAIMDEAEAKLGAPSILVNNACHSVGDSLETWTAESLDAHYAVNVRATVLLSVEFARRFTLGEGGRIINMTSGQSLGPMPGEISYAATKGAIDAFTRTFASEAGPKGITVNAVNPGPTDTGWMDDSVRLELAERSPYGRVGQPEDAARIIAFLAGDESSWVTGQVLHSTGGFW